jgi:hypothetical protein
VVVADGRMAAAGVGPDPARVVPAAAAVADRRVKAAAAAAKAKVAATPSAAPAGGLGRRASSAKPRPLVAFDSTLLGGVPVSPALRPPVLGAGQPRAAAVKIN